MKHCKILVTRLHVVTHMFGTWPCSLCFTFMAKVFNTRKSKNIVVCELELSGEGPFSEVSGGVSNVHCGDEASCSAKIETLMYDDCSCSAPKWKVWWLGPHQNQIQRQCRICEIFTYKPHISFPLTHIRIKPQNSRFMMGSVMKMVQKVWVYEHDGSFFLITDITITLKKFWNALSPRWQNRSSLNVKLPWWIRRGSKAIIPFCASSGVGTTPRRHPGCTHPQRNPQIVHLEAVSRANPKIKIICKSHTQWRRSTWPCQNSITIWTRNNPFRGTRRARPERWRWAGWSELLAQQNCLLPSLPFWDEVLFQNRSIVPLHDNSWGGIIPVPA